MSLYKRGEVWWTLIYHEAAPGGRLRESTRATDEAAAQRYENKRRVELDELALKAPKLKGKTWGMACELWLDAEERSDSELLSLAKFARNFPDRLITAVTGDDIVDALEFCDTAGTYTRYRTMLMAILNLAKKRKWIAELPEVPRKQDKKTKPFEWLTREQFDKLYTELPAHMRPMAEFAVETGLRQANVLGLTWARLDLERRLVWVEAEDTKADKPLAVPLSDRALEILQSIKATKGHNETYVFTFRGKPISEIKTAFINACVRAEVGTIERWVDKDGKKRQRYSGFNWHGFRHTWATWHVQNGTPLDVLQKLGGWSDLRMVLRYAHHNAGYLAQFANNTGAPRRAVAVETAQEDA